MGNFGNANFGLFGGGSSGGGGTSTGINGLNGTTNIGLGGTLTGDTDIDGGNLHSLSFTFLNSLNSLSDNFGFTVIDSIGLNERCGIVGYSSNPTYGKAIQTFTSLAQPYGFQLDFLNSKFTLGDFTDFFNGTKLVVDDVANTMQTFGINGQSGLDFNFSTELYILGATNSNVTFDVNNNELTLSCSSIILSNTPSITSATITTTATATIPSEYITIFINGAERKIQLFDP